MSILKKLAGQTLIYGLSSVLGKLLNTVLTPFFTKLFSQAVYGIYGFLYAGVAFINVFLTFGMETTFFRFLQDDHEPEKVYQQAFLWVAILASLFLCLGLIFSNAIAGLIGYPEMGNIVSLMAIFIFLDAIAALPLARLRYQEKAARFAAINLSNILVNLISNYIFLLVMDKGIEYIFVSNVIASSVRCLMALWGNLPRSLSPSTEVLKPMLNYGFFIMVAGMAGIANETFDRLMIPKLWEDGMSYLGIPRTGEEMNGIYGANYKLAMLVVLFTQAYRYAVEPFFFKESGNKDSPETFAKVFHYFTISTLLGFLAIGAFKEEVVSIRFSLLGLKDMTFIDEKFWEGLNVVPILLGAYVCSAAYINISIWFKITKQTRFAILFTGTGALITILVNVFGIPKYGFMASAWATLICYVVMVIMVYLLGQKYYPIPYRIGRILLYGMLCLMAYYLCRQMGPSEGFTFILFGKIGLVLAWLGLIGLSEYFFPTFGKQTIE